MWTVGSVKSSIKGPIFAVKFVTSNRLLGSLVFLAWRGLGWGLIIVKNDEDCIVVFSGNMALNMLKLWLFKQSVV